MILNAKEISDIYLCNHYTDLRLAADGLIALIYNEYEETILDHSLYIFTNRNRNRLKLIYYDGSGYWLLNKRLERGRYKFTPSDKLITLNLKQLEYYLEGYSTDLQYMGKLL